MNNSNRRLSARVALRAPATVVLPGGQTREVRMGLIVLVSGFVLVFLLQAIWRRPDTPVEASSR